MTSFKADNALFTRESNALIRSTLHMGFTQYNIFCLSIFQHCEYEHEGTDNGGWISLKTEEKQKQAIMRPISRERVSL